MSEVAGLLVQKITPLCQLQDLGRAGYQRFGVSRSGAMDPYSLRLANILAGNPQGEGCLEFALAGAVFEVTAKRLHFAFVGHFPLLINDEPFPANASYTLAGGERIEIVATDGARGTHGYLAVLGGFAAERQLGSLSTHLRSGIGTGLVGAASAATSLPAGAAFRRDPRIGRTLPVRRAEAPVTAERQLPDSFRRRPADTIRAVPGPQTDQFSDAERARFFDTNWRIDSHSDRMGYRLAGATIAAENAGSMISEPVSPGSVQIPAGGQPIVLMPDCGTVGGYPKIATVISVDRGRLGQLKTGTLFRFSPTDVESAQRFSRGEAAILDKLSSQFSNA